MGKKTAPKIISITKLLPNLLTIFSLCAGLTSIRYALQERWELVIVAILLAAFFDALDGAVARLLKAASMIGAELDSLSDFLSFGVAPALVLYLWIMQHAGNLGWFASMGMVVAVALRLARFNIQSKNDPEKISHFFQGVPSPAGALLALSPLYLFLYFGENNLEDFPITANIVAVWMLLISGLMMSTLPTISFKNIKLPQKLAMPLLLTVALMLAALVTNPWLALLVMSFLYLVSIPFSYRLARKHSL